MQKLIGVRWLGRSLAWGFFLGVLIGLLRGIWVLVAYDYLHRETLTLALHALQAEISGALFPTLGLFLALSLTFFFCYGLFSRFALRPAPLALVATPLVLGWPPLWYWINKTDWFPDFWSLKGVVANAGLFLAVGLLALVFWKLVGKGWEKASPSLHFRGPGRWVLVGCALVWLGAYAGFFAANAALRPEGAEQNGAAPRVLLIGVDGVSWEVVEPLLRQGKLPHIQRLMESGAYGSLATLRPTLSPAIWTTVATGRPVSEHGISGFVTEEGQVVTRNLRRSPALWNILSDRGLSVGVVGWWVTWPAEEVKGFMVSPYAGMERPRRRDFQEEIPHLTYPEELIEELKPLMAEVRARRQEVFRRIFPSFLPEKASRDQREAVADTGKVLFLDELNATFGLYLLKKYTPDFFAFYLQGTDVAGHRFWKYRDPKALPYRVGDQDLAVFGDVIDNYYIYADEVIGRFLKACSEDTSVLLLSDHGMSPYMPEDRRDDWLSGHHRRGEPGILVLSGKSFRKGHLAHASVLDIAPTVLYLLGLPLDEGMAGYPLTAALKREFVGSFPPFYTAAYRDGQVRVGQEAEESGLEDSIKERLRSLGYIQ